MPSELSLLTVQLHTLHTNGGQAGETTDDIDRTMPLALVDDIRDVKQPK